MELVDFLRARLDEEQAEAEKLADFDDYSLEPWAIQWEETGEWNSYSYLRIAKARVLAEVDAKRQIVDEYATTCRLRDEAAVRIKAAGDSPDAGDLDTWDRAQREATILEGPVTLLALPYADHPDYQQDWKP